MLLDGVVEGADRNSRALPSAAARYRRLAPQGLFLSVVTLILTIYMVCIFAPMNAGKSQCMASRQG